jgi:hypothetical protein
MTEHDPELEAFSKFIEALAPWLVEVVLVGGWAHRLYRLDSRARKLDYVPLTTLDGDVAVPTKLKEQEGQPSERSLKLQVYESLFLLNEGIDQVIALLQGMENLPFAEKESLECAVVEIEEVRCDVNADFTEKLADSERFDEGRFWKRRRTFEKKWRDPDDVYIEVPRREEERKKQGLPPRLGVLPYSALTEQEQQLEVEQARKKAAFKKSGRQVRENDRVEETQSRMGRK